MKKTLEELFPEVNINPKAKDYFKNVQIDYINAYKRDRKLEIFTKSAAIVPTNFIDELEKEIKKVFGLSYVQLVIKYDFGLPLNRVVEMYWDDISAKLTKKYASCIGFLKGSEIKVDDNKLIIKLKNNSADVLFCRGCDKYIEKIIKDSFSVDVKVNFKNGIKSDHAFQVYTEYKNKEESRIVEKKEIYCINNMSKAGNGNTANNSNKKEHSGNKKNNSDNYPKFRRKADNAPVTFDGKVIMGKMIKDSGVLMRDVTQDSGTVTIKGEVFRTEHREIKGGKFIYIFDITDHEWSLTVKMFLTKDKFDAIKERVKVGTLLAVRGEAQYDKFSKELSIMAYDITEVENDNNRQDNAEIKRVELHLHTQMSSMDAVNSASEMIKRAAKWGHKAIAITDHGVVQAFPEARMAAKKNNIKIIYGVECYLLDDNVSVVENSAEYSLKGEFIVFDIETTGLNFLNNKITEIGAVKVKDFQIVDRFSTFVNPQMPIPSEIIKLTGITDEMVKDAPIINEALQKFLDFAGNAPLVAHNAKFDTGFIKHFVGLIDRKIDNIVIDTLQLARWLINDIKRYKLSALAKYFGVSLENAHRALDDAHATAEVYIKLMDILVNKGINNVDEINRAMDEQELNYKKLNSYHAIILVKNMQGLNNLYKIISKSHLNYFFKRPRVPKKLLMQHREGLILGSACEAGELYSAVMNNRSEDEIKCIVDFYDYLEIQPTGNNLFQIHKGLLKDVDDIKEINRKILSLGRNSGKPVVATCDVHFLEPRDEVFRRILMAGQGFSDADNQAPLYLRTTEEMLQEFDYLGEEAFNVVVRDTNLVADMVEEIIPIPDGTFPPFIEGCEEEIKRLALSKAKEIYGDDLPEIVQNQIDKELNSIIKNGFSVMYIIAQKLVWKSVADGYLVGSRGSVGSSFVANMVGITEVNSLPPHYICTSCKHSEFITDGSVGCGFDLPEKDCPNCGKKFKKDGYDIPFETFLGFDGDKEPDIDLNFSGDYQPRAHKYTEELFGEGHVFRAGTIGTIAEKTAYGFVKNYLDDKGIIATNAEINRLVKGCTGVKRTTGQHPGGIMIVPSDRDIHEFCPIQKPADDVNSNIITTHFDYHSISGKLLKLDILGHDDPTVIRMLEDLTGIDARTIEIGERRTMGIFGSTEPLGIKPEQIKSEVGTFAIPEFGTKFVRQMLVDTKPKTFSELIRISGLSHGTDVWLNNAQELVRNNIASLSEVICTRDDIMLYLLHAGLEPKTSFKIMEDVRKGKGLKEEYENAMKEKNVPDWYIKSCKKIKYMFPKAHAAAYVMMAFRIAWFKVYHPIAFYVTYYTVRADDFDAEIMIYGKELVEAKIKEYEQKGNDVSQKEKNILTILEVTNEMYARGIKFLPIDLYKSHATKFLIVDGAVRPPLNSLQGLGVNAAKAISNEREKKEFISIEDMQGRTKVTKTVVEILAKNKCLDGLPPTSQITFF